MHAAALIIASAVTISAHGVAIQHMANKRSLDSHVLQARQTDGFSSPSSLVLPSETADACLAPLMSAYSALPTPPAALLQYEAGLVTMTDFCAFTIPSSLTAALSSYESQIESWYSAESSAIISAESACPQYSGLFSSGDPMSSASLLSASLCNTGLSSAATTGSVGTATGTAATGITTGSVGTGTRPTGTGSISSNAAPLETGVLAQAGLVAVGALVVALL